LKSRDETVALQNDLYQAGIIGDYDLQRRRPNGRRHRQPRQSPNARSVATNRRWRRSSAVRRAPFSTRRSAAT
jgi:hypothetical protein